MFGQGKLKSVKDMNNMISLLFEMLADLHIKSEELDTKQKNDEVTISNLKATIEVLDYFN